MKVQYEGENRFSVFTQDDRLVLEKAEVYQSREKEGEAIIRSNGEQKKIRFLTDKDDNLYCLDIEGGPMKYVIIFTKF